MALTRLPDPPELVSGDAHELGHRNEALDADYVYDAAPAIESDDSTVQVFAALQGLLQGHPALFADCLVQGQDGGALRGLPSNNVGDDIVAYVWHLGVIAAQRPHLAWGDYPLRLVSHIDQYALWIRPHHDSLDHIPSNQGLHRLDGVEQLLHVLRSGGIRLFGGQAIAFRD